MGVHDEHRQRMKERFLKNGLDSMHDHEVLELLLFYAVPRRDVNPIAHGLLEHFGSLHAVFEAPVDELCKVKGVGPGSAALLHLVLALIRRYEIDRKEHECKRALLNSTEKMGAYMQPYFLGQRDELVMLACVDHRGGVLNCQQLSRGSLGETRVSVRKIVEIAMRTGAYGVLLAHNHPGGFALPSSEDMATTRKIQEALRTVEIALLDHIVVADDDYVSFRDSGML